MKSKTRMVEKKINRRRFIQTVSGAIGALALGMNPRIEAATQEKVHQKPNILVIITDDQRWDALGCAGNPIIHTPHMDRLAANGVRFENAFATTPICAASRATIFTGLYERAHRFNFGTEPLNQKYIIRSYPYLLRKSGYYTGFVGKLDVDVDDQVPELFDFYRNLNRNPYFKIVGGQHVHLTEITGNRAIQFLKGCRREEPFCLTVSFNAPHAEDSDPRQYFWPPVCNDLYQDIHIPPAKLADPGFFEALPDFLRNSLNRIRWKWRFDNPKKYQQMVKGYYRMISGVDHTIGSLIDHLKSFGLYHNTVIIMISDNGYFLGERGFAGKWLLHEPSIRVPLIIFDPRQPEAERRRVIRQLVSNVDLAPTILDLAKLPVPGNMHGKSVLPLVRHHMEDWRDILLLEHLYQHPQIPQSEGVRTEKWKYIRYPDHGSYAELYDLHRDALEEHNLAMTHRYKPVRMELEQSCNQLIDSIMLRQP